MEITFNEPFIKLLVKGNHQILIISCAGGGKSILSEVIDEEKHDMNYLIINPFDPKEELELAFAMFPPQAYYHLKEIKKIGKEPSQKKVKIYHPFTFHLPKNQELPPMEIYTLPIADFGRDEVSFITESESDSEVVRDLLSAINLLGSNDGLLDMIKLIEKRVKGTRKTIAGKQMVIPEFSTFFTKSGTTGTQKTVSDIASYFSPFLYERKGGVIDGDYCIAPRDFKLNLDIRKILRDQEHYHVFSTKWIRDEKVKYFVAFRILNMIYDNLDYAKYPIVLDLPEIGSLVPYQYDKIYKKFMAFSLSPKLAKIRSKGRGVTSIMGSQVWTDINREVRSKATVTMFGKQESIEDIGRIKKDLNYGKDIVDELSNLKAGRFIIKGYERRTSPFKVLMPSHMHKEENTNFFSVYRRHFPELMVTFNDIIAEMRQVVNEQKKDMVDEVQKELAEYREIMAEKEKTVEEKKKKVEELEMTKEKLLQVNLKEKERLMNECLKFYQNNMIPNGKKFSYREAGRYLGIDHKTVKNYINLAVEKRKEGVSV